MKTKIYSAFLAVFFTMLASLGISNQAMAQVQSEDAGLVKMYYFHFNTRCETCRRITSYNVCYTKLLRRISHSFRKIIKIK